MKNSFAKKNIIVPLFAILSTSIDMINGVILSRVLMPEGIGFTKLPFLIGAVVIPLVTLGIGQSNILMLNAYKINKQKIVNNSIYISVVISLIMFVFIYFSVNSYAGYFGHLPTLTVFFASISIAMMSVDALLRPVMYAEQQAGKISFLSVIVSSINFIVYCVILLTSRKYFNVDTVIIIQSLSLIILSCTTIFFISDKINLRSCFDFNLFTHSLKEGKKYLVSILVEQTNSQIGPLILKLLIPDFTVLGLYIRAASLSAILLIIPASIGPMLFSRWASMNEESVELYVYYIFKMYLIFGCIVILFSLIFSDYLIVFIYGSRFAESAPIFNILISGVFFRCLFSPVNNYLASRGKSHITAFCSGCGFTVIIVLNFLIIPVMSARGASIAYCLGSFVTLLMGIIYLTHGNFKLRFFFSITRRDLIMIKGMFFK